jgi:hypothetical protein
MPICLSTCTNLRIKIFKGFNIGQCNLTLLLYLCIGYNWTTITDNLCDELCVCVCVCLMHFEHNSLHMCQWKISWTSTVDNSETHILHPTYFVHKLYSFQNTQTKEVKELFLNNDMQDTCWHWFWCKLACYIIVSSDNMYSHQRKYGMNYITQLMCIPHNVHPFEIKWEELTTKVSHILGCIYEIFNCNYDMILKSQDALHFKSTELMVFSILHLFNNIKTKW